MNYKINLAQLRQLSGPELQLRLLAELDDLFREIEDGTVKENTFTGCIALEHRSLPPLIDDQSRQIQEVLLCAPLVTHESARGGMSILIYAFNIIRRLWGSHDTTTHPAQNDVKADSRLLDQYGRVRGRGTSRTGADQNRQLESQEIQETDVKQFFAAQGEDYTWVLPYAWDIANQLNAVKKSATDGDLALFLERRRKLNVGRPKATRFEQSVQRYAAKISKLYCNENGDITNEKALEAFIRDLVITLLDKTKAYWPTSPLLAIFDGVVATVIRPLLHKHRTSYIQSKVTTATGVIVSGNITGKTKELVTTPQWNDTSQRLVVRYVKKAFKSQVWPLFLDRYARYNRDYSKSPHMNAATLPNVGLLTKNFGDPLHLRDVMNLLQPTNQPDELAQYVVDHFRDSDFLDH